MISELPEIRVPLPRTKSTKTLGGRNGGSIPVIQSSHFPPLPPPKYPPGKKVYFKDKEWRVSYCYRTAFAPGIWFYYIECGTDHKHTTPSQIVTEFCFKSHGDAEYYFQLCPHLDGSRSMIVVEGDLSPLVEEDSIERMRQAAHEVIDFVGLANWQERQNVAKEWIDKVAQGNYNEALEEMYKDRE